VKRGDFCMSPLQCRVLSMLAAQGGEDGISATQLAALAGTSRAVFYVMAQRLRLKRWVRRYTIVVRGAGRRDAPLTHTMYAITASGRKARERYAFELGVWPP
jgi:hypothetical protein